MFEGIITPIVTPFHRDEKQTINYEATEMLVEHLIDKGISGIFVLGSNGEFYAVDEAEKIEFTKTVVQLVNQRVPVFAGSGACSTHAAIRMSKKMEYIGVDALSVISPYFVPPSEDELYQYYEDIAKSVTVPVVLYNIPRMTGVNISANLVSRLSKIENIVGIKDSSRNLENLKGYVNATCGTQMSVLVGSDSIILDGYRLGATGAIAGLSNIITDIILDLFKALKSGDEQKAELLQKEVKLLSDFNKQGTMPSVIKRFVELSGIAAVGPARRPVLELSREMDKKIVDMIQHYGLV
ncbi:dihydrodipicolinate synthase family protein [Anaerosinus massiliensis]|uniref:dihydrodipicolinate synthase family protein n=1 Tax=Massilibacillus massiliensis TaxID=1806837 RepID=UPI000DA6167E|nr:dihydrodipicolinate synthase family protein [Massilibacillus massiliensis]